MIVDYHMHLRGASAGHEGPVEHTADAVEPYVEAAASAGVDEIGFTEHMYYFRQTRHLWDVPYQLERCCHDLDGCYFEALRGLAGSGVADVLAHPDLVKIYGRRPGGRALSSLWEETAEAIESAGVAVEVSTAGLRKPVGELYPDRQFLARCRVRGVGATTASDAHVARDVGRDLDRAVELLRAAGYETVTVFEARQGRQEPLDR